MTVPSYVTRRAAYAFVAVYRSVKQINKRKLICITNYLSFLTVDTLVRNLILKKISCFNLLIVILNQYDRCIAMHR